MATNLVAVRLSVLMLMFYAFSFVINRVGVGDFGIITSNFQI